MLKYQQLLRLLPWVLLRLVVLPAVHSCCCCANMQLHPPQYPNAAAAAAAGRLMTALRRAFTKNK
jgi:hypothetical protein